MTSGKVSYLGKTLPPEVATARAMHDLLLPEMVRKRRGLIDQADALARLIRNAPLRPEDREIIEDLGFGDALVRQGSSGHAQDEEEQLSLV